MSEVYDLIIVGAGIAGVSSAIYAKRSGMKFLLLEKKVVGGQLLFIEKVDNYAGVDLETSGAALVQKLDKTLNDLNIKVKYDAVNEVKIDFKSQLVSLESDENSYQAKTLIVATGASSRNLGLPKEKELTGRGISFCAVCDGFFFKGKTVAVVGGGNTAAEDALYLSNLCKKVYLIHRRDKLRALDYLQHELFNRPNIEILWNKVVKEIKGEEKLEGVVLEDTLNASRDDLSLDGLFIAVGIKPNTEIVRQAIELDEGGFIVTDSHMRTSCDFIFACGDCRKRPLRQLITAAGEGAISALSAYRHLKGFYTSS